jgi:hypothetical protein
LAHGPLLPPHRPPEDDGGWLVGQADGACIPALSVSARALGCLGCGRWLAIAITAWGGAKNVVDKVRASAGKTSSVGASGVSEETTSQGVQNVIGLLVQAAMELGKTQASGGLLKQRPMLFTSKCVFLCLAMSWMR